MLKSNNFKKLKVGLSLDVYNVAELPHQQSPKPQWTLKSNYQKSTKRTLIKNKKAPNKRGFSFDYMFKFILARQLS